MHMRVDVLPSLCAQDCIKMCEESLQILPHGARVGPREVVAVMSLVSRKHDVRMRPVLQPPQGIFCLLNNRGQSLLVLARCALKVR